MHCNSCCSATDNILCYAYGSGNVLTVRSLCWLGSKQSLNDDRGGKAVMVLCKAGFAASAHWEVETLINGVTGIQVMSELCKRCLGCSAICVTGDVVTLGMSQRAKHNE